jgi:hypothetical protein
MREALLQEEPTCGQRINVRGWKILDRAILESGKVSQDTGWQSADGVLVYDGDEIIVH